MMKTPEIRERIRAAVSSLHEVDDRLAELAESLPLPPDAAQMWDSWTPTSFTANLYAALEAVRSDCIQDAVATLLYAVRQSDASLRREWAAESKAAYPPANDNTPAISAGWKETPRC
jgi:hypothetical protein